MANTNPISSLTCSVCGKVFKKLWSLSYHKKSKHGPGVGLEGFPDVQVDMEVQLSNITSITLAPAQLLLVEIVQLGPTACITPGPLSGDDNVPDTPNIYQNSDLEYETSEGSDGSEYQDNSDSNDDDPSCEIVSDDDISAIQDADLDDDVLEHDHGGQIHNIKVEACPEIHVQEKHHCDVGHPYHPWKTAKEVGITNLVYAQAHMMMDSTNKLLQGFKNGLMKMEGLSFHSSRAMRKILDAADYVPVWNSTYYVLFHTRILCTECVRFCPTGGLALELI
jgi:hypothetical protein